MRRHNFSGWAAALAGGLALFIPAARAIDAQIFNGTSNTYLYVYYDTDWVESGTPVNVHMVAYTYNGGSFAFAYGNFLSSFTMGG